MPKLDNLVGKTFNEWTVLYRDTTKDTKETYWICECSCGNICSVNAKTLKDGTSSQCRMHSKKLEGKKFGRLLVIKDLGYVELGLNTKKNFRKWRCCCDCGTIVDVLQGHLLQGDTKSCGCLATEGIIKRSTIHGMSYNQDYIRSKNISRYKDFTQWTVELDKLLREQQQACVVCGISNQESLIRYDKRLSIDHVTPFSKGGILKPGNVVMLCYSCNSRKKDKTLIELLPEIADRIYKKAWEFEFSWRYYRATDENGRIK